MAIPVYEGEASATSNSATSVAPSIATIDGGSPPSVGQLLIAKCAVDSATATNNNFIGISSTGGAWHDMGGANDGNHHYRWWWKIRESGDGNTVTFTSNHAAEQMIGMIICISGTDLVRPIARQSNARGSATTQTFLAETTPVADCLAVAWSSRKGALGGGHSSPSSWSKQDEPSTDDLCQCVETQGFASASSSTGTVGIFTENQPYMAQMLVIQPPQGGSNKKILAAAGTLASPTSTGNQDITGLGFDAKALMCTITRVGASVTADAEMSLFIGADDGVTAATQFGVGVSHDSGTATEAGYNSNGKHRHYFAANVTVGSPDLEFTYSRIAGGFRLNWTAVDGSSWNVQWIAFGGADLRATCGASLVSAGAISSLPWRPDVSRIITQCFTSSTDALRETAGLLTAGWLDHMTGAQFCHANEADEITTGNSGMILREGFSAQNYNGALTWEAQHEQTTGSGWSWDGSDGDYFFYLSLNFGAGSDGDTNFPFEVHVVEADDSGTDGQDQGMPMFANGGVVQVLHAAMGSDTTQVDSASDTYSDGYWSPTTEEASAIGKTGTASERVSNGAAVFLSGTNGDLDTAGKVGDFTDQDTIDWSTNDTVANLIGLFRLGEPTLALEQEGFRWRDDDGSESGASWLAAQDTNASRQKQTNTRLRVLTDATGNPPTQDATLQYRKVGDADTEWRDVPES